VGQHSTSNTTKESAEAIKQDYGSYSSHFGGMGSPRQLTSCPWCGSAISGGKRIDIKSYPKESGRMLIYCSDHYGQCPFSRKQTNGEDLPIVVVDEEIYRLLPSLRITTASLMMQRRLGMTIYRLLPSLRITTVDKFAQLWWKGEAW
jgi:hypothetical protein